MKILIYELGFVIYEQVQIVTLFLRFKMITIAINPIKPVIKFHEFFQKSFIQFKASSHQGNTEFILKSTSFVPQIQYSVVVSGG